MGKMMFLRFGIVGGVVAGLVVSTAACTVENSPGSYGGGGSQIHLDADSGAGEAAATVAPGSSTPSPYPLLAVLDDNVKMNASPGQGVGVFNQYDSGGHWTIWWTCDTNLTNETCPFDILVTSAKSSITNATSNAFGSGDTLNTQTPTGLANVTGGLEAKTTTTTEAQGIEFDTDPGATIQLVAKVGGLYNGKFLFWVQSGKVNGGYDGTVTDPLLLVGGTP
jgi:hypothetical protein